MWGSKSWPGIAKWSNRRASSTSSGMRWKINDESEAILEHDAALQDMKMRNRLTQIQTMLSEKMLLISKLDKKILSISKINDVMKEV